MLKLEHIGIAVRSLSESIPVFEALLNTGCYKEEMVESESVRTAFFAVGDHKVELLESSDPEGIIARYIAKNGEGIHHIALAVDDIWFEMKRLEDAGFELLNDKPKTGADNKLVCFLHPKNTHHVLVELCMDKKETV